VLHNSEKKSYQKFEELRCVRHASAATATVGLHCVPTLLSGSLDSGFHMFRGVFEPMGSKKFEVRETHTQWMPQPRLPPFTQASVE
jgi:hypothetical protein